MEFGKRLKEAREEKGLSQRAVADMLKIGRAVLSKWETDVHRPSYETLVELAKLYNISIDYLLGLKDF